LEAASIYQFNVFYQMVSLQLPVMEKQMAVSNAHASVYLEYDATNGWVFVKWSGHITCDEVVAAAEKYTELVANNPVSRILNDKSEVSGDWQEANDWLEYEWMPQAVASGLQYFAMVLPPHLHDLATAQDLGRRLGPHLQVKMFHGLDSAKRWLVDPQSLA